MPEEVETLYHAHTAHIEISIATTPSRRENFFGTALSAAKDGITSHPDLDALQPLLYPNPAADDKPRTIGTFPIEIPLYRLASPALKAPSQSELLK